jgi:hypothetical protein
VAITGDESYGELEVRDRKVKPHPIVGGLSPPTLCLVGMGLGVNFRCGSGVRCACVNGAEYSRILQIFANIRLNIREYCEYSRIFAKVSLCACAHGFNHIKGHKGPSMANYIRLGLILVCGRHTHINTCEAADV